MACFVLAVLLSEKAQEKKKENLTVDMFLCYSSTNLSFIA